MAMNFKTNLLPSNDFGYNLGSSTQRWNIFGNLTGNAATATSATTATTATNLASAGTWAWTNGTTAGPTAKLTIGGKDTTISAIPAASASYSGIITTGAQTFGGTKTINGKLVVNPYYDTATNSYNEGIRINVATNGWAEVAIGGAKDSTSGETGTWIVGKRGAAGTSYGAVGDFTIDYNGSNGAKGLTLRSGGGAIIPTRLGINGENASYNLYVNGTSYIQTAAANSTTAGLTINNGLLKLTNYSNTITIGSQNESWAHFSSSKPFWFSTEMSVQGNILPYNETNTRDLGSSSSRWRKLYVGTADTYGSTTQPIYWNAGVPTAITSYSGNAATATKVNNDLTFGNSGITFNGSAAVNGGQPVYYIEGSSSDAAGLWTMTNPPITTPYNGLTIIYVPKVAGQSSTKRTVTNYYDTSGVQTASGSVGYTYLKIGNYFYPCYYTNTTQLTTHFAANTPILFTFYDNKWKRANYNSDTNTLLRTYASATNINVPLLAQSSANSTTAAWSTYTGTYKDWYGAIPNDDTKRAKINLSTGHLTVPGGITADLTGNAATATTATNLAAAGTWTWANGTTAGPTASLVIGGKTTSISAIPAASTSNSGIITTGAQTIVGAKTFSNLMTLQADQYADTANTGALNLRNSDIYGVNSIKFADLADSAGEGLQWYRDSTHIDSMWVKNGLMYFTPNRTWGGTATNYIIPTISSTTTTANYPLISTTTAGNNAYNTNITMNGGKIIVTSPSGSSSEFTVTRTGGPTVWLGVGSGNVNHGVYSDTLEKWIVYADNSNVYLNGNAATATKLATARTISLTGSVTGSGSFDGSGNLSITTTTNHTHSYAGSSSAGGSATSAVKLDSNAGSTTQPIYFSGGKPTACGTSLAVSITGNAATATKVNQKLTAGSKTYDGSAAVTITAADIGAATSSHSHSYLPLSGGTMSGNINMATTAGTRITGINGTAASSIGNMYTTAGIQIRENNLVGTSQSDIKYAPTLGFHWANRVAGNLSLHSDGAFYFYNNSGNLATVKAGSIWGAVWNDYAEYRQADTTEPGRCIVEVGDDTLELSTERMQPGAEIISDTFGFAIGETDTCRTPIATTGRVLAYPFEDIEEFRKNIGHPVCSGPNGTVSIMTDNEYKEKAYCAIGTISAVPDYETWGTGEVKVNGRVWIRVK